MNSRTPDMDLLVLAALYAKRLPVTTWGKPINFEKAVQQALGRLAAAGLVELCEDGRSVKKTDAGLQRWLKEAKEHDLHE